MKFILIFSDPNDLERVAPDLRQAEWQILDPDTSLPSEGWSRIAIAPVEAKQFSRGALSSPDAVRVVIAYRPFEYQIAQAILSGKKTKDALVSTSKGMDLISSIFRKNRRNITLFEIGNKVKGLPFNFAEVKVALNKLGKVKGEPLLCLLCRSIANNDETMRDKIAELAASSVSQASDEEASSLADRLSGAVDIFQQYHTELGVARETELIIRKQLFSLQEDLVDSVRDSRSARELVQTSNRQVQEASTRIAELEGNLVHAIADRELTQASERKLQGAANRIAELEGNLARAIAENENMQNNIDFTKLQFDESTTEEIELLRAQILATQEALEELARSVENYGGSISRSPETNWKMLSESVDLTQNI